MVSDDPAPNTTREIEVAEPAQHQEDRRRTAGPLPFRAGGSSSLSRIAQRVGRG